MNLTPCKVLTLDLSEGIPELQPDPNYEQIRITFWWHGIALGQIDLSSQQLPLSAAQLSNLAAQEIAPAVGDRLFEKGFRANLPLLPPHACEAPEDFDKLVNLQAPLQTLHQAWAPLSQSSLSVVICTRDRPEKLAVCLRSLQSSTQPPDEIIVVDNAPSSDATQQVVTQMPGIQYVREPRPGLDIARNTGIAHSTCELIAYTDDDVAVHPDWSARIRQSFRDSSVMAVTGLVLAAELETEAQQIFERDWSFNRGYRVLTYDQAYFERLKPSGVPAWCVGAGANMAFRRSVFEQVGTFDERLDVGAAGCSGDSEFWYRIMAEGYTCQYEPIAVVSHYHRRDMVSLSQQLFYYMRGHVAALLIQFERYKHWGNIGRLGIAMPKYYLKRTVLQILKRNQPPAKLLLTEIIGCFAGIKFYLQNRQRKPEN
ncbi:MAG: glycosyltransferase family 2 protein [Myxacorys chilensis ATA2-1-KO14]|jgi:GT2 family glycosyltransferase|nr:glycosyltransferase family 2 protein [Myxacorys chilensis ATA2-1-KO14]